MKKTLGILFLALLLTTATVFAASIEEIYGINANEYPPVSKDLPLVAVCRSDEVNVRNEPNTSSEVVANIDKNATIYVHSNPIKSSQSTIPWYEVTIDNGIHGYIRADFIEHHPNKLDFNHRFEAAFNSSVLYDVNQLCKATNYTGKINEIVPKPMGDETHTAELMDGVKIYAIEEGHSKYMLLGAKVRTSNYTIAGLKVGDDCTLSTLAYINEAMEQMNWSIVGNIKTDSSVMWVFKTKHSRNSDRIVTTKSFIIYHQDGKITGFYWGKYLID